MFSSLICVCVCVFRFAYAHEYTNPCVSTLMKGVYECCMSVKGGGTGCRKEMGRLGGR